jgi:transposase
MVRTNDEKFREKILDQNGYKWLSSQHNFKLKEFDWQREYTDKETKEKHQLKYRVITYWSQAFADRERFKRDRKNGFEDKLKSFIGSPTKLNSSNSHGVKRYLKETIVEKKTGEVKNDHQKYISVDWDKFHRDIEMDGYYAIITNDYDSTPIEIIQKYKELWKIEEIFKVTKSNLEGRPVYVWNNNHIEGHFLINFLSLLIMKLIQMKMNWKYSASKIQEALNSCQVQKIKSDIYSFNLQTQEWKDIAEKFNFKVNFDFQKYESINKTIRETLKQPFTFL